MPVKFEDHSPTTLTEAIDVLESGLNEDEREYLKTKGYALLHHGPGTAMRNAWGLWHDSALAKHFKSTYGLTHADDMSGLIFEGLVHRVRGTQHDVDAQVQSYKAHWAKYK